MTNNFCFSSQLCHGFHYLQLQSSYPSCICPPQLCHLFHSHSLSKKQVQYATCKEKADHYPTTGKVLPSLPVQSLAHLQFQYCNQAQTHLVKEPEAWQLIYGQGEDQSIFHLSPFPKQISMMTNHFPHHQKACSGRPSNSPERMN